MKNILFFTHNLFGGGAEKTVRNISNYMNRHYDDVRSYVCVVYDAPEFSDKVDNLIVMNNKTTDATPLLAKPFVIARQIMELRRIKKEKNIDVCISFLPGADLINVSSGIGEKQIVSVRNVESYFLTNPFKKMYDKYSYARCDKIVAVTNNVKRDLIENFDVPKDKIVTVYNAIDDKVSAKNKDNNSLNVTINADTHESSNGNANTNTVKCSDEFLEFTNGKFVFINVARLATEKCQDVLLEAFAKFIKDKSAKKNAPLKYNRENDPVLVIVGDGPESLKLRNLVKKEASGIKVGTMPDL